MKTQIIYIDEKGNIIIDNNSKIKVRGNSTSLEKNHTILNFLKKLICLIPESPKNIVYFQSVTIAQ